MKNRLPPAQIVEDPKRKAATLIHFDFEMTFLRFFFENRKSSMRKQKRNNINEGDQDVFVKKFDSHGFWAGDIFRQHGNEKES